MAKIICLNREHATTLEDVVNVITYKYLSDTCASKFDDEYSRLIGEKLLENAAAFVDNYKSGDMYKLKALLVDVIYNSAHLLKSIENMEGDK